MELKSQCWQSYIPFGGSRGSFGLWCWRRRLRVPWTARRSNQSILKEISPGCSLEGLMLKMKLQYFGHLMWRTDSLEKNPVLGKIEGGRRRGWQNDMVWWHHWLNGYQALGVGDGQGSLVCFSPWGLKESDMTEWLNWLKSKKTKIWALKKRKDIIFSHCEGCLFTFLIVSFVVQKILNLIKSHLFTFVFISITIGGGS